MRPHMHLEVPPVDTLRYPPEYGASGRNRTSDTRIFSPLLYRLSYGTMAVWTGLEPATSAVTGRHSNQLNYQTIGCGRRI